MKKKWIKKGLAIALSTAMVLGVMPSIGNELTEVYAADSKAPTVAQYIDMSSLSDKATGFSSYNLTDTTNAAKIKFGASGREWLIAGADGTNTLALLSATSFGTSWYGNNSIYGNNNNTGETSKVLGKLNEYLLDTTYFSAGEQDKMQSIMVKTTGYDDTERTVTGKLYLPDAQTRYSHDENSIYVGTNNNIKISLTNLIANGMTSNYFWLRSPFDDYDNDVLVAFPGSIVGGFLVNFDFVSVVPAFDLNLSSVLFASAANAATSEGTLTLEDAFTLRYASTLLGSATINPSVTKVAVSDAPSGTCLVVQNSDGAWAQNVSGAATVNASDVTINSSALTSFTDCKVWLETTDTDRITTATLATQATGYSVAITNPSNSHIILSSATGNGTESQTGLTGDMTDVKYIVDSGYYFPTKYNSGGSMDNNGVTVTRNSYTQITVSGIPTANAFITLGAATEKAAQDAPTGLSDGVDKIAGTTTTMEYASTSTATTWNTCTDGNTTVAAGTWYVRYKETDTQKAAATAQVTVTASQNPPILYQVTVNNGSGDDTYVEGATVTITADSPTSGKQFKEWTVVSGGITLGSGTSESTTFTMPAGEVEVTATYEDVPAQTETYVIKSGANGIHQMGSNGALTITCSGALADLTGIYVDGKLVDESNYTLQSGSTILTLKVDYLNGLSVGTHTLTFEYGANSLKTSFQITAADSATTTSTEKDDVPKTGDSTPIAGLMVFIMISGAGILYFGRRKKIFNK